MLATEMARPRMMRLAGRPAQEQPDERAQDGGHEDLAHRTGDGDGSHGREVAEREVDAHAEHEQHDPDLGELEGQVRVCHEPRREGPDGDAGHEVAHDGRHPDAPREQAEEEGERETDRDRRDEDRFVVSRHGRGPGRGDTGHPA